jgi:Tfp pilus assembly protein PilN
MNNIKIYFEKILSLLRVRSIAGGLEISDQVLRLVYFNGTSWQMAAIKLAPGVLEKGVIKNLETFTASLRELKLKVPAAKNPKKKVSVVVSLSSVNIYSQVFNLPILEGDELESAIRLNVQTLSPGDASQTYAGYQLLGKDDINLRLDISAAFIEKKIVDDMSDALFSAGFLTVGVESRALALVRILREKGAGIDIEKSYLLLNIDNSGLDFLIVRKGQLYFEYTNQWSDLADDKGQIAVEKFEEQLSGSLRQVTNFYSQHWPEPLSAVILSASAFGEEAEKAINNVAVLPIIKLTLVMGQPISSEWLVALGCSMRGFQLGLHNKEINLSGEGAMDTFRKEQFLHFINFWRVVVPVVLALVVIMLAFADNFLLVTAKSIAAQSTFDQQGNQLGEITALEASSTAFNESLALIQAVKSQQAPISPVINKIINLAATSQVTINTISFQGITTPISVNGITSSENNILTFKAAIAADPDFGPVVLSLSNIQVSNGVYSFSMTFPVSPLVFQN